MMVMEMGGNVQNSEKKTCEYIFSCLLVCFWNERKNMLNVGEEKLKQIMCT